MIVAASVNDFVGPRLRKTFGHEAIQAWVAYLETGLHLSGHESRDWLETWRTEIQDDLPAFHK
jgi:predicted transcriptional regulator